MIYIWVRSSVDWTDESAFRRQLSRDFAPKVALWDATFTLPFHVFRHRVWSIARRNHEAVAGAALASWDAIPEGALVLPTDDDDWFAPDVATTLAASEGGRAIGYRWPSRWVEVPTSRLHAFYLFRRRLFPWLPFKYFCSTNNYALVKGEWSAELLRAHVPASTWFLEHPPPETVRIARVSSVANRTLASQTTLGFPRRRIGRREIVRKFHRYKRLYRSTPPPELAWARPYLTMMGALMDELALRQP